MEFKTIDVSTKEEIDALGSALTLEGLAESSFGEYLEWVDNTAGLKEWKIYRITGESMNEAYGLTGNNAYPSDLTIASIDLDDIADVGKVIMARFNIGARWLDDIIDNNARREKEEE